MKVLNTLSLFIALTSCATSGQSKHDKMFEARIKQLEYLSHAQGYMLNIDRCHIDYLLCRDKKVEQKKCWMRMETCAINQYRMYEQFKKRLGP